MGNESRQETERTGESLRELIGRIRRGDEEAATRLVQKHENVIRLEARLRLKHSHLSRLVDSVDICQSVLGSFLVRAAEERFAELEDPQDLLRLLLGMARNKVVDQTRRHRAARRDIRRSQPLTTAGETAPPDAGLPPDEQVALNELLARAGRRLTPVERKVAERRATGETWAAIGAELNLKPDTLRRSFRRSGNRISRELNWRGE